MTYTSSMSVNYFAPTHANAEFINDAVVVRVGDAIFWPHAVTLFFDDLDEARRVITMALGALEMLHRDAADEVPFG